MDLNGAGTFLRTAHDQEPDVRKKYDNWLAESWKNWPNEAQFEGLEEHRGPVEFPVTGTIPAWAAGSLYRIGPGETTVEGTARGTHRITHWFDGTAHTHRFDIVPLGDGSGGARVVYSSRRQGEAVVADIRQRGWLSSVSFGQRADPCVGVFAKVMSVFEPTRSNNNVDLIPDMPGMPGFVPRSESKSKPDGSNKTEGSSAAAAAAAAAGHRTGAANLIATTDSSFLQRIDPDTLAPLGHTNQAHLHPDLRGQISCAHARRDPATGDLFNFNLELGAGRFVVYRVFRVDAATGAAEILATFSGPKYRPAYIHSFFLTENYVVLCLPSAHFAWEGLKIVWLRNFIDAIKPFDGAQPCRWLVVDRRHGKGIVAEFTTPASFFFHSVNSFEEYVEGAGVDSAGDGAGGEEEEENGPAGASPKPVDLVLDMVQYDTTDIMHTMYYDILLDRNDATRKAMIEKEWYRKTQSSLVRYRFRLDPSKPSSSSSSYSKDKEPAAEEVFRIVSPHSGDLPATNPRTACRPYRYVWSVCNRGLSTFMDALVKTDLHTREALIWSGPRAHSTGEPIFVPRPRGEGEGEESEPDEDDGVILSLVLDGERGASYLVCLDARTMVEVGRAEAPFAIALGLHGSFRRAEA